MTSTARLAILIDADNAVACLGGQTLTRLCEYLERYGHIQSLRAYGDWERLGKALNGASRFHVSPVHLPTNGKRRKNGVDIAMAVDAIDDLHLAPEIDTFVLVSGDGDLGPVALRLRERGRRVIGLGRRQMTSDFLVRACDEFIYLERIGIGVDQKSSQSPLATQVYDALRNGASPNGHHATHPAPSTATDSPAARQTNGTNGQHAAHAACANGAHGTNGHHPPEAAQPAPHVRSKIPPDLREAMHRSIVELESSVGAGIGAGTLKQQLLRSYSTFKEKDFGVKRFSEFLTIYAEEIGIVLRRDRGNSLQVLRGPGQPKNPTKTASARLTCLASPPSFHGFRFVATETFRCGEQEHRLPVYRCEAFAAAIGHSGAARDPALEFVLLPGGTFTVGHAGELAEAPPQVGRPPREVSLAPFLIARTPMTQQVWDALRYVNKMRGTADMRHFTRQRGGHRRLPIEGVSWHQATTFLTALGMRLPSEAQWEVACRGGVAGGVPFYWGYEPEAAAEHAWTKESSGNCLHAVATAPAGPNAYGLYDMAGNLWEWCADAWHPSLEEMPTDGSARPARQAEAAVANETLAQETSDRELVVVRGGSFHYPRTACRVDFRWRLAPEVFHPTVGFRPVVRVTA